MDRPWLRHYPSGVAAEIDPSRYSSLIAVLEESFAVHAGRDAFACMGKTMTYAAVDEASRAFAAWLQSKGLQRGARVAVMMPNVLQYPIAIAAILRAGFTVVNVNPLYKPRELEFQLADAGAEVIVVLENFAYVVQEALPRTPIKHVVVASLGEMLGAIKGAVVNLAVRHVKKLVPAYTLPGATTFTAALAQGRKLAFARPEVGPDDIAFLQYTGGTTGVAKGAMLLHRNIVANLLQARAWLKPFLDPNQREIVITPLPLYHIFSLTANCLTFMTIGGENILIPNPRDIPGFIAEMGKHKFTAFTGVNTLFN